MPRKTREEAREWEREYWARPENRERKRQKDKRYYEKHKNKCLEYSKKYAQEHQEQRKETCKRYYKNHTEEEAERQKEYLKNNREKQRAHWKVYNAIKTGELTPQPCEKCGEQRAFAHHDDYEKPLVVRWLCHKCHMGWHAKERKDKK